MFHRGWREIRWTTQRQRVQTPGGLDGGRGKEGEVSGMALWLPSLGAGGAIFRTGNMNQSGCQLSCFNPETPQLLSLSPGCISFRHHLHPSHPCLNLSCLIPIQAAGSPASLPPLTSLATPPCPLPRTLWLSGQNICSCFSA